jgi:hypothetical protein
VGECRLLLECQVGGLEFFVKGCTYDLAYIQLRFEGINPEIVPEIVDAGFQSQTSSDPKNRIKVGPFHHFTQFGEQ